MAEAAPPPATSMRRRRRRQPKQAGPRGPTAFSRQHPTLDLIFNVVSGQRDPMHDLRLITATLAPAFPTIRVWKTTPDADADALAADALAANATLLVACGGDGTVTAVASAIKAYRGKQHLPRGAAAQMEGAPLLNAPVIVTGAEQDGSANGSIPVASVDTTAAAESGSATAATAVLCAPAPVTAAVDTDETRREPVLGVIPRGTANALCAALHIPSDPVRAAEMIVSGPTRTLDFPSLPEPGRPAGAPPGMLLLCGVGLEAETVVRADRRLKRMIGAAAYAVAGINSIWRQQAFTTDLVLHDVDDSLMFAHGVAKAGELRLAGMSLHGVTVANAAPAASVLAQGIGEVRPDDGLLEVVCFEAVHPLDMIRTMFSMLFSALMRTRETRRNVYGLRARKVEIVCDPPQKIVVDGEDVGYTPITVELSALRDSIQVVAPKAGTVNRRRRRLSRYLGRLARNIRGFALFALTISLLGKGRKRVRAQSSTA